MSRVDVKRYAILARAVANENPDPDRVTTFWDGGVGYAVLEAPDGVTLFAIDKGQTKPRKIYLNAECFEFLEEAMKRVSKNDTPRHAKRGGR